ncbi:sialate O-acetylesterase [Williamsia phyllosphaerae]|uniref:Acetylxylan esterase n=1 Tax=Williamsia phyllosphaerae TaxID=885042 RepID=A0ABQ1UP93_9NOCA|nr:sialate O-acetylesterase [Williamsia phyllosphaerae]GGF22852.1 acetylxylan esterase [Williamsia phyllosphaerae]
MPSPFDPVLRTYEEDRVVHGSFPVKLRALMRVKTVVKKAIATGTPVEPFAEPYTVVAILGQSNAAGAGIEVGGTTPTPPNPRVHQWPGCGRYRGRKPLAAVDPLVHEVPTSGVGFATEFGSLLADATGEPVLLVPTARGDTSFYPKNGYSWDPGNSDVRVNLFKYACAQIDSALEFSGQPLSAILWHQGESDGPLTPADEYQAQFDLLIASLRVRYGPVPFILGQLSPEYMRHGPPKLAGIDAVHRDTPNRHPHARFVPSPDGMLNGGEDPHFNAEAGREIGRRMYAAYAEMVGKPAR